MSQPGDESQIDGEINAEEMPVFDGETLADLFGKDVAYAPDAEAPPIDYRSLRALVRGQLDPEAVRAVAQLIAMYRPWYLALCEVLRQEPGPPPA